MCAIVRRRRVAALGVLLAAILGGGGAQGDATPFEELSALVRAGSMREALARIDDLPKKARARPRLRYLRARLLEANGSFAEAIEAYEGLTDGVPAPVVEDARDRRARLLASLGRCKEAEPLLRTSTKSKEMRGAVARALAASCALAEGDLDRAVEALRAVAKENAAPVDTFAVRLQLAEALHRRGDVDAARSELRSLLLDRPEHPDAARAEAELVRLGTVVSFSWEERLRRAEKLLRSVGPARVLTELEEGQIPSDRAIRAEWLRLRGMALFRLRTRYEEASQVLAEATKLGNANAVDAAFHAARALSRADRDAVAIQRYRALVKKYPTTPQAAEAEYLAAWLELHHGRKAGARAMEAYLKGPRGRSNADRAKNGHWYLGLGALERRAYAAAADHLDRYAKLGSGALDRARGLYWLGRAHQKAGARGKAVDAYKRALEVEALHWYALLSRQRLLELGHDPGPVFPPAPPRTEAPRTSPAPELPEAVAFYESLGLHDDALEALERLERTSSSLSSDRVEWLAAVYRRLGDVPRAYRVAASRARSELGRAPDAGSTWAWEAAYPRPYRDEVEAAAAREGISSELVYAVMRQESGYQPDVVSPAGAVGLLQLMPSTAEKLAHEAGVPFRREMLFDPAWNIRFGATLLGKLIRLFEGDIPLAVAAYNAGEHRVQRWKKERGPLERDHFVERIPFDETRNYVRRVMSHYARYRFMKEPSWPEL